jgi:hypothetical protein
LLWGVSTLCAVVPPPGLYGVVGTGVLWDVNTLCAALPPPGLYGVVGTGVLGDASTPCAVVPPPGLYGVVGTGLLWGVSTLCAVVPPPGLYVVVGTGVLWDVSTLCAGLPPPGLMGRVVFFSNPCSRGWSSRWRLSRVTSPGQIESEHSPACAWRAACASSPWLRAPRTRAPRRASLRTRCAERTARRGGPARKECELSVLSKR